MDLSAIVTLLAAKFPIIALILGILGALVIAGQAIVVMTPSKMDDEAWDKLKAIPAVGSVLSVLALFAPIQKK